MSRTSLALALSFAVISATPAFAQDHAHGHGHAAGSLAAQAAEAATTVDAFHAAALAAGGRDNGPPGVRETYGPTYYAAFVLDPDGFNIEAVCHAPA